MIKKQRDFLRLRHAKQYDEGTRKNPFFFKAPPKRMLVAIVLALCGIAISVLAIGFTHLPWFQLSSVSISGVITLDSTALEQTVRSTIDHRKLPFISKHFIPILPRNRVRTALLDAFPLADVFLEVHGTALTITVTERVTNVVWRNSERTTFFNLSGEYVRDATPEESRVIDIRQGLVPAPSEPEPIIVPHDMPVIVNTNNDNAESLSTELIAHIMSTQKQLAEQGILTQYVLMDGVRAPWARWVTDQQYDLLFDLARDSATQIAALRSVTGAPGFIPPDEYIDLRFGAYVYMK